MLHCLSVCSSLFCALFRDNNEINYANRKRASTLEGDFTPPDHSCPQCQGHNQKKITTERLSMVRISSLVFSSVLLSSFNDKKNKT